MGCSRISSTACDGPPAVAGAGGVHLTAGAGAPLPGQAFSGSLVKMSRITGDTAQTKMQGRSLMFLTR